MISLIFLDRIKRVQETETWWFEQFYAKSVEFLQCQVIAHSFPVILEKILFKSDKNCIVWRFFYMKVVFQGTVRRHYSGISWILSNHWCNTLTSTESSTTTIIDFYQGYAPAPDHIHPRTSQMVEDRAQPSHLPVTLVIISNNSVIRHSDAGLGVFSRPTG